MLDILIPGLAGVMIIAGLLLIFRWLGIREHHQDIALKEQDVIAQGDEALAQLLKEAKTIEEKEEILQFASDKILKPEVKNPDEAAQAEEETLNTEDSITAEAVKTPELEVAEVEISSEAPGLEPAEKVPEDALADPVDQIMPYLEEIESFDDLSADNALNEIEIADDSFSGDIEDMLIPAEPREDLDSLTNLLEDSGPQDLNQVEPSPSGTLGDTLDFSSTRIVEIPFKDDTQ